MVELYINYRSRHSPSEVTEMFHLVKAHLVQGAGVEVQRMAVCGHPFGHALVKLAGLLNELGGVLNGDKPTCS